MKPHQISETIFNHNNVSYLPVLPSAPSQDWYFLWENISNLFSPKVTEQCRLSCKEQTKSLAAWKPSVIRSEVTPLKSSCSHSIQGVLLSFHALGEQEQPGTKDTRAKDFPSQWVPLGISKNITQDPAKERVKTIYLMGFFWQTV